MTGYFYFDKSPFVFALKLARTKWKVCLGKIYFISAIIGAFFRRNGGY
jgi:hypothetical protein